MYFKSHGNNFNKNKGFKPHNPNKTPMHKKNKDIDNSQEPINKYNVSKTLSDDTVKCAEIEAAIEVVEILTAIPEQIKSEQDLLNLLQERDSYLDKVTFSPSKKVSSVMLSDRPKGKNLLKNLSPDFIQRLTQLRDASEARKFQEEIQSDAGFTNVVFEDSNVIDMDFRHIIRMEFNGKINKPDEDSLSDEYLMALNNPCDNNIKPKDYDLDSSPIWQKFKLFPNFKNMEADFRNALALQQISPSAIVAMNSFDFEDILFKYKSHGDEDKTCIRIFEGAKEASVKIHTRNHKKELEQTFKEMGANEEEIKNALYSMEKKGIVPAIQLSDGNYLTASVHHDIAILDAGTLQDPTQVNNPNNHRIVFRKNKKDENSETFATKLSDKDMFKAFNRHKIELNSSEDLNLLSSSPEAKQDFIKKVTREKLEQLFMAFKDIGLETDTIQKTLLEMAQTGKIPQLDISKNRFLAMQLKQTKKGLKLVFGIQEKDSDYTDVHRGIFHGNSTRPVYFEEAKKGEKTSIVPHEGENSKREDHKLTDEKDIYAIEASEKSNRKKISIRVRAMLKKSENSDEKLYPVFFMDGISDSRVIWANMQDINDAKARQDALANGSLQYKYERNNNVR